jgi:hypothetical protein
MPETLASFRGSVSCTRAALAPQLTLSGSTAASPPEEITLAFSAASLPDCPGTLQDVQVEHLGGAQYRISSGSREWRIESDAVHLHREVAARFYRAIPPRAAPWRKRMFWRLVLILAASRAGVALLKALRR